MKRVAVLFSVLVALAACSVALAAAGPKPKAGAWKFSGGGGFKLVSGKGGKLFVTAVKTTTAGAYYCDESSDPIKVVGRFPLKWVTVNGSYPLWAVGKPGRDPKDETSNTGLIALPAKVFVAGKQVPQGGIKVEFNYADPTTEPIVYIEYGGGKEPGSSFAEPLCVKAIGASR
jgi:hypothetical protein